MLSERETIRVSKFLSLVLRHKPETIGIKLDDQGWAPVPELIERGYVLGLEDLKYVVETNSKKRFKLSDDTMKIRASQGHSVEVDLGYKPQRPPKVLYHGTGEQSHESIFKHGLLKQERQHVHLSSDVETAIKVGQRHGKPIVFEVFADKMYAFPFFLSDNGVWLTERVPPEYLCLRPLIKPITQKRPYKPDCGDILSGGEYLVRMVKDKEDLGNLLGANIVSQNPWSSLKRLGIDTESLKKAFKYHCPYTGNIYYHFIPAAILVKSVEPYRKYPYDEIDWDWAFDLEWNRERTKEGHPELNNVGESMLGHGYTEGTLPSDGSGSFIKVLIELSNGDYLFGYCWEWYNK